MMFSYLNIHKIFELHAFLLKAHGAQNLTGLRNSPYNILVHRFFPRSNKSIRDGKDSVILIC